MTTNTATVSIAIATATANVVYSKVNTVSVAAVITVS